MKYIVVVIAGAADLPSESLSGKTPLEMAKIPHLHHFCKIGKAGQGRLVSDRLEILSDSALFNLFGFEPEKTYTGRGPLEAADMEIKLEPNEVAFRMNFITESEGRLADSTAGHLSTKEARAFINFLNKKISSGFVRFFAGSGHRHIAVIKDSHGLAALSAKTVAPGSIAGEKMEPHFPKGPGEELLKKLMFDAKLLLQDHEINQVRVDLGENPANMIWLWGQGCKPELQTFKDIFGLNGALISDKAFAKGFARLAGLTAVDFQETGALDSQYEKVAKLTLELLAEKDVVCLYLDGCDEASQRGDLKSKVSHLEAADFFLLSRIRDYLEKHKEARLLITPAYASSWENRRVCKEPVPFIVAGKNVMADDIEKFFESAAKTSALKMSKSGELMRFLLQK